MVRPKLKKKKINIRNQKQDKVTKLKEEIPEHIYRIWIVKELKKIRQNFTIQYQQKKERREKVPVHKERTKIADI